MPDGDNLARSLPKAWRGAYRAALGGPEHLGKYLAHITVKEIPKSRGVALLEPLAQQLAQVAQQPLEQRLKAGLRFPEGSVRCRDTEIALHAAERVLVEIVNLEGEIFTTSALQQRLYEAFVLEIPRVYCIGVLSVKGIPGLYTNTSEALEQLKLCEETLKLLLKQPARELTTDPVNIHLTYIPKPKRARPTQVELVGAALGLNLGALGMEKE